VCLKMLYNSTVNEGPWPSVDCQAYALSKSGIFLKSGHSKSIRKRFPPIGTSTSRDTVLQHTLQLECQKLFVDAAGSTGYMRADPDVIFGALCELCRHHGVVPVPSFSSVVAWLDTACGESFTQVISLSEFTVALKTLCPSVFEVDGFIQLPAVMNNPVKDNQLSYGLVRRKHNASLLCDGTAAVETRGDRSVNNKMTLIADSDHLCEAMKRDGRSARKCERPHAYANKLEKHRINDILRSGPVPDNVVRVQKSLTTQRKARHGYTTGLSTSLGCNVVMVQRHMDMEAVAKKNMSDKKVIQSSVNNRRTQAEAVRKFSETARKDTRDLKATHRRQMMEELKRCASMKQESIDAMSSHVRHTREVLHWSTHKSGFIPKDEVLAERKANAATYGEWRTAANEDALREGSIRDERLAIWVQEKVRNGTLRSPISMGSVDATDVFMRAFTTDEEEFGFTDAIVGGGVFLDNSDCAIAESRPPANMLAAARVYGQYPKVKPPAFMSGVAKGPKEVGYSGPRV
jgi:hypothetical protein